MNIKIESKKDLTPSFGPERRGAPVLAFTKIDDTKIHDRSELQNCDYVVVMDETLVNQQMKKGIKLGAIVVVNTNNSEQYTDLADFNVIGIDATSIALEILGRPITNTAMYGALVAASDIVTLDEAIESIKTEMKPSLPEKNIEIVKRAYKAIKNQI